MFDAGYYAICSDAWYFCILINILGFCFQDAVELLETFWCFRVFLFWCVRRVWGTAQFGADCPLLLRQARHFSVFYPMPCESWSFPLRLVGTLLLALYEHQALFPLIPLDRSFPGLTHGYWSILYEIFKGDELWVFEFPLHADLTSALWGCVLRTPAILDTLDSKLHLLN